MGVGKVQVAGKKVVMNQPLSWDSYPQARTSPQLHEQWWTQAADQHPVLDTARRAVAIAYEIKTDEPLVDVVRQLLAVEMTAPDWNELGQILARAQLTVRPHDRNDLAVALTYGPPGRSYRRYAHRRLFAKCGNLAWTPLPCTCR